MKDILPPPPPIVRNQFETIRELFSKHVVPSYARFDLAFSRGSGSHLWDVNGRRYLDLGGGIAVCCLGHANAEITQAIVEQSQKLVHVSNLYYHEPQGRLAQEIVRHLAQVMLHQWLQRGINRRGRGAAVFAQDRHQLMGQRVGNAGEQFVQ